MTDVRPIQNLHFSGETADKEVTLTLTDDGGEERAYKIDPATLSALLPPMISIAARWAEDPAFAVDDIGGTQNAMVAKNILIAHGRNEGEAALRVFLGTKLDLTFLLPVANLMAGLRAFAQQVLGAAAASGPGSGKVN